MPAPRSLGTVEQVQEIIPASRSTLLRYAARGWLPAPFKLAPHQQARLYWDLDAVEAAVAQFAQRVAS